MNFEASVLDAALTSLPSCVRCRARRIGCDQSLPSCQPCLTAGTECELYDYMLEAKFPRSYLLALNQRLQSLERLSASVPPGGAEAACPPPPTADSEPLTESVSPDTVRTSASSSSQPLGRAPTESAPSTSPDDHTSPTARSRRHCQGGGAHDAHDSHYQPEPPQLQHSAQKQSRKNTSGWGISSAVYFFDFVCQTFDLGTDPDNDNDGMPVPFGLAGQPTSSLPATAEWLSACFGGADGPSKLPLTGSGTSASPSPGYPPFPAAKELVRQYCLCIEAFTPIVGRIAADADLYELYAFLGSGQTEPKLVRPVFRAQMMLAIALRIMVDGANLHGGSQDQMSSRASQYGLASDAIFVAAAAQLRRALERPHHHHAQHHAQHHGGPHGQHQQRRSFSSSAASSDELEIEETLEKLQIVLLLVVYLIMCPSRGNVWQILGFADRLWRSIARSRGGIDMNSGGGSASFMQSSEETRHYQMLQKSFAILERLVSTSLGRPVEPLNDYWRGEQWGRETESRGAKVAMPTLSTLLACILSIKARVHAAYQSAKPAQHNGEDGPSTTAMTDRESLHAQILEWRHHHDEAVKTLKVSTFLGASDSMPGNEGDRTSDITAGRSWLHEYGQTMADETELLALSLHWQETGYHDDEEAGDGGGESLRPVMSLDEASLREGVALVQTLVARYTKLYNPTRRMVKTDRGTVFGVASSTTTASVTPIPAFPFTWLQAIEVFRVAVVASFLDRVMPTASLQGEIEALVQVLDKGRLYDSSSLVSAIRFITP